MSEEVKYVVLPKGIMDEVGAYNANTEFQYGFSIIYRSLDFENLHSKYGVYSDEVLVQVADPKRFDRFMYNNRQAIRRHETQRDVPPQNTYSSNNW